MIHWVFIISVQNKFCLKTYRLLLSLHSFQLSKVAKIEPHHHQKQRRKTFLFIGLDKTGL